MRSNSKFTSWQIEQVCLMGESLSGSELQKFTGNGETQSRLNGARGECCIDMMFFFSKWEYMKHIKSENFLTTWLHSVLFVDVCCPFSGFADYLCWLFTIIGVKLFLENTLLGPFSSWQRWTVINIMKFSVNTIANFDILPAFNNIKQKPYLELNAV